MNNQVFLMKLLNHKNILKLFEIIETKTHAFLVYEYFNGVKLSDYIAKKKKLNEEEAIAIFKEILSALVYIHGMYICDLNLSSNNIIVDSKNNIKICDFKYGHFYSTKEKSKPWLIGDSPFLSPELHSKKNYNPELADMWSCGVILYHMLVGNLPFNPKKELDMIRSIIKVEYIIPSFVKENMKNLIKRLIEKNEEKRFKLNDIFNLQYFKDKKITKKSLVQGLNILTMKYPIDPTVLNICVNNLGIEQENLVKFLENNKFTPYTSLFKQIVTKLTNKGIKTINDLCSDKFVEYINDHNNFLQEESQINNIQNYLKKEEDVRKNAKDVAAILLNNQNEISKGLSDLKRQFVNAKKGLRPRQNSFNHGTKKRRKFDMDAINYNAPERKKNINIKYVKRNTYIIPEMKGLGLKDEKNEKKRESKSNNQLNANNKNVNNKIEEKKIIEEIKEEEEKEKEEKKDELNKENSVQNDNNEKKEEIKKETPQQRPATVPVPSGGTLPKMQDNPNKINMNNINNNKTNNVISQMQAVKLTKVNANQNSNPSNQAQKKPVIPSKNDTNINKNIETHDKKPKINIKKEEVEKEMIILKNKNDLKKIEKKAPVEPPKIENITKKPETKFPVEPPKTANITKKPETKPSSEPPKTANIAKKPEIKPSTGPPKTSNATKKPEIKHSNEPHKTSYATKKPEVKPQGIKSIKEMIEATIKKQAEKKKAPGKK